MAYFLGKREGTSPFTMSLFSGGLIPGLGGKSVTGALPTATSDKSSRIVDLIRGLFGGEDRLGGLGRERIRLGGYEACKEKCKREYDQAIAAGRSVYEAQDAQWKCMTECTGGKVMPSGTATEECPRGSGPAYEGCQCGTYYLANNSGDCVSGYVFMGEGEDSRCECQNWISAGRPGGRTSGALGEYQYPSGIQALMDRILGRAGEFLSMKPGYSDAVIRTLFGQQFDKIRQAGRTSREQMLADLQQEGLLGTGAGLGKLGEISWQTEKNVANIQRDIFLANEAQKKQDMVAFTDAASRLLQQGLTFEQIREAINAARRSESQAALALMLQYLTSLMSAWG